MRYKTVDPITSREDTHESTFEWNDARSDEELAAAIVAHGDTRLFTILERRMRPGIRRLLLTLCNGNPEDAEDAEQEALLAIYDALDRFGGRSSLRTYWFRIAKNVAIDLVRVRARERRNHQAIAATEETRAGEAHENADPAQRISRSDEAARFRGLLAGLPESDRIAIHLFYVEELSIEDVARVMEVRPGTVKSRLHRARNRLFRMRGKTDE